MELDASIEPTIGPYEVYEDEWFNAKAAFEAFIAVRDDGETAKLAKLGAELQGIEDSLPIDPALRNPKLGGMAPIRVVNVVLAAGDGNRGVQTAAYNLPNDERVVREKGAKRVMLRNIQEAKFNLVLRPIAATRAHGGAAEERHLRRLLHAHRHARADARPRAAPDHRRRQGHDRAGAAEGHLQRDGGGEGRHLRPVRAAASDRQGRPAQVDGGDDLRHVPRRRPSARSGSASPRRTAGASRCS